MEPVPFEEKGAAEKHTKVTGHSAGESEPGAAGSTGRRLLHKAEGGCSVRACSHLSPCSPNARLVPRSLILPN